MKLAHQLLAAFAVSFLAAGAFADDVNPTGLWKGFDVYQGDVLLIHPIFSIELKNGKLTGKQTIVNAQGTLEYRPLMNAVLKDGVISFDIIAPAPYTNGVKIRAIAGGDAPNINGGPGGSGGITGGRRPGGASTNSDPFNASDDTIGRNGGKVSYQGTLVGNTIIGQYTKDNNAPMGLKFHASATAADPGRGEIVGKWIAARVTPTGIWDVSMHVLPGDGEPLDSSGPLRAVTDELMRFDSKNLVETGEWRRSPVGGHRQVLPIKAVAYTPDGFTFSVAVENPAGKTVYEFTGGYVGAIDDDIVRGGAPKVTLWPNGGAEVDDFGRSIDVVEGKVKITGPDGKVYNTKWHAERDTSNRAKVDMGDPYEVTPAAAQGPRD